MGNAQTHCVQLPNTFAFARGATGATQPGEQDYIQFADDLIHGRGPLIVQGWQALSGQDPNRMRMTAGKLETAANQKLTPGPLNGLLFGDPKRFLIDLVMELRLKAAYQDFVTASERSQDVKKPFRDFVETAGAWQQRNGYECAWSFPKMDETLKKLHSPVDRCGSR